MTGHLTWRLASLSAVSLCHPKYVPFLMFLPLRPLSSYSPPFLSCSYSFVPQIFIEYTLLVLVRDSSLQRAGPLPCVNELNTWSWRHSRFLWKSCLLPITQTLPAHQQKMLIQMLLPPSSLIRPLVFQLPSCVQFFATTWTAARQTALSLTISQSLPKFMSIVSVMPSSPLILWCPLFLLPSIFPRIRDFSNESAVCQVTKILEL